jgi:hypothetical protein
MVRRTATPPTRNSIPTTIITRAITNGAILAKRYGVVETNGTTPAT